MITDVIIDTIILELLEETNFKYYKPCGSNFFVVHEHKAKRTGLHYDIRLTYINRGKCVLLSFATRKLPELVKCDKKRIQVFPTEDHSLDYANFKGKIPEGYGAGDVKIWDKGNLEYFELTPNKIKVKFKGRKLKDCYTFIDINESNTRNIYDKSKSWLLIKNKKCEK